MRRIIATMTLFAFLFGGCVSLRYGTRTDGSIVVEPDGPETNWPQVAAVGGLAVTASAAGYLAARGAGRCAKGDSLEDQRTLAQEKNPAGKIPPRGPIDEARTECAVMLSGAAVATVSAILLFIFVAADDKEEEDEDKEK